MGARKKIAADKKKEARKSLYFASAKDIPSSPRKMRLVADMVRGMEVGRPCPFQTHMLQNLLLQQPGKKQTIRPSYK